MNKNNFFSSVIITLIAFIFLHNAIINFLGNINSFFKKNNKVDLEKTAYLEKIEYLEKTLLEYENNLENLNIYDSQSYVLGKTAIRDIYDFYNYIVLSTDSLVEKDNLVINEDGLVGIVESANKKTAKVNLLTGNVSLSVKVSNSYGLLDEYDKESGLFVIHNINNYRTINVGDEVTTSGLTNIKSNINVGVVDSVKKMGIEQIVYVKSNVNFDDLNYLYIIKQ